jgi:UDP-glucose 4-epimerase
VAKYLVTGGCGFIGSHLADYLVKQGCEVSILDDLSTGKKENAPKAAELVIGSITDPEAVRRALVGVHGVFHLAAVASVQKSFDHWQAVHEINCGGTVQLFEALAKLPKKIPIIYASSSGVYGSSPLIPASEETPVSPLSPYGIDKLSGEWHAKVLWNVYRVPSISLRLFNVYGPRQDPSSPYSGVISIFSKRVSKNLPLTIYGDGEQVRDFIYVKDVARAMAKAMRAPMEGAKIYNLCTGNGTSINFLADMIGKISSMPIIKEYAPEREGEVRISIGDPSRARTALEFNPRYSLEDGLNELTHELYSEELRTACV